MNLKLFGIYSNKEGRLLFHNEVSLSNARIPLLAEEKSIGRLEDIIKVEGEDKDWKIIPITGALLPGILLSHDDKT